ncbi:MAG TPA: preprotein translocase subunit SecY, partial [Myxococcaceae bacterium]|nr:preprotein translocase subunit SecY [Myxococcaceae bacterium]
MALNAITNMFRIAELRARLLYTLALLAVYRVGIFISTPGVDRAAMNAFMEQQKKAGGLVNLFNLFSGGALEQMSIFALGIMPYVSASIIMQLLAVVVPTFERLQKEG